ncbi:MAG TPA: sulfatase-like hydrolase/transferase, partial [Polyangia bacterium]|nr:sulfatase-like hydrolase/transferase [Polyangia bacterium]
MNGVRYTSASALLAAWTALNLLFNVRYPAPQPAATYFLPSIDATLILAGIAAWAWRGRRLPGLTVAALALAVVLVRALRIGDGVVRRYFNRPFDVGLDLPTAGEIGRLMRSTVSLPVMLAGTLVLAGCTIGFATLAAWSIRAAERSFAVATLRWLFAAMVAIALVVSPLLLPDGGRGMRQGLFAPSALPRFFHEGQRLLGLPAYRRAQTARVRADAARVAALPHDLGKLAGDNVLLFFVESYGATVLEHPQLIAPIDAIYRDIDAQLGGRGFQIASRLIDSPTYGGRSQLAHQALLTGVRASNRIDDAVVQDLRPKTMADLFHDAGYRTVLVMPGTTHRNLYRWVYDFDKLYAFWDLGYQGPTYAFGAMPDQFVIDAIHRSEVAAANQPLLITYALVSSHAPWDRQPPFLSDWSQLGDGRVFWQRPTVSFPTNWSNLPQGAEAYGHAIACSLQVIASYLATFDLGNTLVIVLGDHQPVADITRASPSSAVPIHIISRRAAVV